jgi:hypothetical protein
MRRRGVGGVRRKLLREELQGSELLTERVALLPQDVAFCFLFCAGVSALLDGIARADVHALNMVANTTPREHATHTSA